MASIKLQGDTSGELTISAPAVAGTNTLTLPASSGALLTTTGDGSQLTGLPAGGKILQVLSVQKTDVFSTTSASLVDVTGLTLTITPSSASSKILFMAFVGGVGTDNSVVQAVRDSTIIAAGAAAGTAADVAAAGAATWAAIGASAGAAATGAGATATSAGASAAAAAVCW